jgi:SAM-dependent methyltransferase
VDATREMLEAGVAVLAGAGVTNALLVQADATALPIASGSADVVTSRLAAHHFADAAGAFREIARILKEQGYIELQRREWDPTRDVPTKSHHLFTGVPYHHHVGETYGARGMGASDGLAKELVRLGARLRVCADTDRQREWLDWCTGVSATERRGQDSPSDGETDLEVGIRQEDRELVPTDPEGSIIPAHDRRRDLTHGDEQPVPRRVPMTVVDGLQPVDVEQHESEWRALPAGLLQLARQLVLEGAMVAEAGQAIEQRGPSGLTVELMHLGPFDVECRGIAQDSAGDDRHECRHREPTSREDHHCDQLACLIRVPETLDRGRAHQDAERHEQPHRQSTSDPAQSLGGRRDR